MAQCARVRGGRGLSVVKLARLDDVRTRRLQPGEEEALLAHAGTHLYALIVAALSTGCRRGELLSLQWKHVRFNAEGEAREFVLEAANTKTKRVRIVPIGVRLRAVLEMRRLDADGQEFGPDAYVSATR